MFVKDIIEMRRILDGVAVIDIASFGSSVSPDYLLALIVEAEAEAVQPRRFGIIGTSLPGNGWYGGLNSLVHAGLVDWIVGGYFAPVRVAAPRVQAGLLSVVNFPQGVLAKLLTLATRRLSTPVGLGTFIDPGHRSGVIGLASSAEDWLGGLITRSGDGPLTYTLPPSQAVLLRGRGLSPDGAVICETRPIDLDVAAIAEAAALRGAKRVFQVPRGVRLHPEPVDPVIEPGPDDAVFEAPLDLHTAGYIPPRYLAPDRGGCHARDDQRVCQLARRLAERIEPGERLIVGIGLPVACVSKLAPLMRFEMNVESGNVGGIPLDGSGFGFNIGPDRVVSQLDMFQRIWSGDIDHAVLGVGELDRDGNINVACLTDRLNGVGGFVDITQSIRKITFCSGQKERLTGKTDWVSFEPDPKIDCVHLEC